MRYLFGTLSFAATVIKVRSFHMKVIKNDGLGGAGIQMVPDNDNYSKVLFWFHGLGDTADGWAGLMPMLSLTDTKFVLPTATNRPITINGGMKMPGWSDIYGLDKNSPEDKVGFDDSAARVTRLITQELNKGISSKNIIIGGFSQGGALALHVGLRSTCTLGGCVALSTWLPFHTEYPAALSSHSKTLPILQIHGDEDMVVDYEWGKRSHHFLKELIPHPVPKFTTIHGMGHSSSDEEIDEVKSFIQHIFTSSSSSSSSSSCTST